VKLFTEDYMANGRRHVYTFGELPSSNLGDYDVRMCNFRANSRKRQCDAKKTKIRQMAASVLVNTDSPYEDVQYIPK